MQLDEFIGQVQARAKRPGEVRPRARPGRRWRHSASAFPRAAPRTSPAPREIGEHLRRTMLMGGVGAGERLDRDEFLARVAERDDSDLPATTYRARVVLELVDDATTGQLMDKVAGAVPDDIHTLIDAGSSGRL
jgi:hypothetical protein